MKNYCGIDLHSDNNVVCVIDDNDKRLFEKRLHNDLSEVLTALAAFKDDLKAVAIESTFNWYWLVDGLKTSGFDVMLVNTAKVVQYEGLKNTNDRYDAFHLAHLMRLGILPTGYIYPKASRGLRDLIRKRMQLVQDRTRHLVRFGSMIQMHTGLSLKAYQIKAKKFILPIIGDTNVQLALQCHLNLIHSLELQINTIERSVLAQVKPNNLFNLIKSVPGIGDILGQAILMETGEIERFKGPDNFASYSRCVQSKRTSNGKKKGENNRKNGNKYLAWAFIEAANFAVRRSPKAKAFYQRKLKKTNCIVARKALAHKLARACYWMMKRQVKFDENLAFA